MTRSLPATPATSTTSTYLPVALVESTYTDRYGARSAKAPCPYCQRHHTHGWPPDQDDVGPRRSHCGAGEYEVTGAGSAPHMAEHPARRRPVGGAA